MKLNEIIATGAALAVILIIALFGLFFVVRAAEDEDSLEQEVQKKTADKKLESKYITNSDGQRVEVFVISEDRVPETNQERLDSPSMALLPTHIPEGYVPDQVTSVPSNEVAAIRSASINFLKNYETFSPDRTEYALGNGNPDPYKQSLITLVVDGSIDEIMSREESQDLYGVCPFADYHCQNSSTWIGGGSPVIRGFEGDTAYVTVTGVVRYGSTNSYNPIAGKSGYREYALVLSKENGYWKVARVVAETGDQLEL